MGIRIIPVVNWLYPAVCCISRQKKMSPAQQNYFKKIWFIPGILSVFNAFGGILGRGGANLLINIVSNLLVSIPMAFLLGWWLTHPYKKERAVYQMPVAQPYGQPVYQTISVSDTTHKVFCSGCGRELSPDENFCSACGKQRTMHAQRYTARISATCISADGICAGCALRRYDGARLFFFPIVGLILYLVWKDQTPLKAHPQERRTDRRHRMDSIEYYPCDFGICNPVAGVLFLLLNARYVLLRLPADRVLFPLCWQKKKTMPTRLPLNPMMMERLRCI